MAPSVIQAFSFFDITIGRDKPPSSPRLGLLRPFPSPVAGDPVSLQDAGPGVVSPLPSAVHCVVPAGHM